MIDLNTYINNYIKEDFYQNVGAGILTNLLDKVIEKGKNTTVDDIYRSLNALCDYLVKNNYLKPINVKGYRFKKYPGIYVNYINNDNMNEKGERGGICLRFIDGREEEYYGTVTDDSFEARVSGVFSGQDRSNKPLPDMEVRHDIRYTLKSYIYALCTDPKVSHFYYISDEKVVKEIRNWLEKTKEMNFSGQFGDSMTNIESIHSLDKLR